MPTLDDARPGASLTCERCGRFCEPLEIETCPICQKRFCLHCVQKVGSRRYCSRGCGETFFYGTDDDISGIEDEPE